MNRWMLRFMKAMDAFQGLKHLTKQVNAGSWTPEYRELAEQIHSMGRDYFHAGLVQELAADGVIPVSKEMQEAINDPRLFDPRLGGGRKTGRRRSPKRMA